MARLEELTRGAMLSGILPGSVVTILDVRWHGTTAVELTYKRPGGQLGNELLFRSREPELAIVSNGRTWRFDADGALLRLVSEAYRIRLAYLFDPYLAVNTSRVEPLPHQITAVYSEMLSRHPLRFLLADDPGAGKTIMAGLLIKELLLRGDLHRCMVVCPGSLVEQWQDELDTRFHLPFEILTNDKLESARTGNWFAENPLVICRLDKLSRNEDVQDKLAQVDWDLIVCDEAHKMSASYFASEVRYTKRYHLGQRLSSIARHFLLMTATPHNGKEEDFQLFMALIDPDRFEGRFRDGVHAADNSDLMRRLTKEQLLKFDGTPLFPERRAYTVDYDLSPAEEDLYQQVTAYVRQEFNRADQLESEGRRGTVGFALTTLQRRLASSPEAIYQSLRRRRERLEKRLAEEREQKRRPDATIDPLADLPTVASEDDWDDLDEEPEDEIEDTEERVVDQATAARTIAELEAEILSLQRLENLALGVRRSHTDRKWDELSKLLQDDPEMFDAEGNRRKLVVFTEHRDTLNYLLHRIRGMLGRPEAVVAIHGGMSRDARREAQGQFTQDKGVHILVATDAAGEGINLQRAHLMVNYDLPWNPNRLEQRFGRIHRIGQTEVCHLWNLVADETREGEVYTRLLKKLDAERVALGGQVFDVLGKLRFDNRPLRELLVEAIRYGDQPDVQARLYQVVDQALDRQHLIDLIEEHALARDTMDAAMVRRVREDMERAEARRLQPHFIAAFFIAAFAHLGSTVREREPRRYEISHVPAAVRQRARELTTRQPVNDRYQRITFENTLTHVQGKPEAEFVCPGHPLLDATIDLILERHRDLMKSGGVLVDPNDPGEEARVLFTLEHAIQDGLTDRSGQRRVISRRVDFVEIDEAGQARSAGYAPYLDYRPLTDEERQYAERILEQPWLAGDLESQATTYAVEHLVPRHFEEVKRYKDELLKKTREAVWERLTKEIFHWDGRAVEMELKERAGMTPKLNSARARRVCDDLTERRTRRMEELHQEARLSPLPTVVIGGALILPAGLLQRIAGRRDAEMDAFARETKRVELAAMTAVMDMERQLGFEPRDVSADKVGYDIESRLPGGAGGGKLRFIEVKGRVAGAETATVTKNEILTALNKPDDWILALVQVPPSPDFAPGDVYHGIRDEPPPYGSVAPVVRYLRRPFFREPDFGVTSVNYDFHDLWERAEEPVVSTISS
ncbi:MAG: helicase-related protein [Anaerolineae bacterium]